MSGLERFQGTADWIQRFKTLLSTNRDTKTPPRDLDSSGENSICIELNEDFQAILEEKKIIPNTMSTEFNAENKENLNPTSTSSRNDLSFVNKHTTRISLYNDSILNPSFVEGSTSSLEITNLSFSAIEQACNKSISDPDSTIHNYVEQIRKNSESKNSNIIDDSYEENEAIERLLRNLEAEQLKYSSREPVLNPTLSNNNLKLRTTFGFADQTQLADVEEPSALWETTVSDNYVEKYQLSPTKMVGLLRPSTILEESINSNLTESNTSENSYNTANKRDSDQTNVQSDVTSQYETACESAQSDKSNLKVDTEVSKINDSLTETKNTDILEQNKHNVNTETNEQNSRFNDSKESFDRTESSNESSKNFSTDSVKDEIIHLHKKSPKKEILSEINNFSQNSPITIEVSDDETENQNCNPENENLNEGFSIQNIENQSLDETLSETVSRESKSLGLSHEFNDTLEEVEYIMKKGMQMLKSSGTNPKIVENGVMSPKEMSIRKDLSINSNTRILSPMFKNSPAKSHLSSGFYSNKSNITALSEKYNTNKSPSFAQKMFLSKHNINTPPSKNSPSFINKTLAAKQASANKLTASAGKDVFRKPTCTSSASRIPQCKNNNIKKSIYADIISPVGAYIKKTAVCPTEIKIKETTVKSLDYGQTSLKANIQYHPPKRIEIKKGNGPSLPQKCYKSASYKCVSDERTQLNIPGGEKIHKYLKPALLPAIVRHDGKMKMGSPMNCAGIRKDDNFNKTVDSTMTDLADLSTISGDVSIYTLRDAQKFSYTKEKTFEYNK